MAFEFTQQQRLFAVDAGQRYAAWLDSARQRDAYGGGMTWKQAKGRDYLFRLRRGGYGQSLGPRGPETERIHGEFHRAKAEAEQRYQAILAELRSQAPIWRAARLGRVPRVAAGILRRLDRAGLLPRLRVVGTSALCAYEMHYGAFFRAELLASGDVDLLVDVRQGLKLALEVEERGLLGLLRDVDKSFRLLPQAGYRAVNDKGYFVDLLMAMPTPVWQAQRRSMGQGEDLLAVEIEALKWLVSAPALEQVVIGEDGVPAAMRVPDIRAFAAYKHWLAGQPDREPLKRARDREQAVVALALARRFHPQSGDQELEALPDALRRWLREADIMDIGGTESLPPDLL